MVCSIHHSTAVWEALRDALGHWSDDLLRTAIAEFRAQRAYNAAYDDSDLNLADDAWDAEAHCRAMADDAEAECYQDTQEIEREVLIDLVLKCIEETDTTNGHEAFYVDGMGAFAVSLA